MDSIQSLLTGTVFNFPAAILLIIIIALIIRLYRKLMFKTTERTEGELRYSQQMINAFGDNEIPEYLDSPTLRAKSGKHVFMSQVILDFDNGTLVFVDKEGEDSLPIRELSFIKHSHQFEFSELIFAFNDKEKRVTTIDAVDAELILHHLSAYLGRNALNTDTK